MTLSDIGRLTPRGRIVAGAVAIGMVAIAWIGVGLSHDRLQVEEAAARRTMNSGLIVGHFAREYLQRVELALAHTADEFTREGANLPTHPARLRNGMDAFVAGSGLIRRMIVLDKSGTPALFTGAQTDLPAGQAAQEAFSLQRDGAAGKIVLGTPYRVLDGKVRVLPASMRLAAPDGGFAGIVIAEIDTAHFNTALGTLGKEPGGFYTLFLRSGEIVARQPHDAAILDRNWAQTPMFREHLPGASRKTVRQVVVATGLESLYSYDALPDYPLVAVAGLSLTRVLEPWRERVWRDLGLLAAGLAVLVLGTWLVLRSLRSERAAFNALAEAERRYRSLVEASQSGVILLEGDVVAYSNPGMRDMLGYARQEDVPATSVYDMLLPESHATLRTHLARLSALANQAMSQQELRMRRSGGEAIDVTATAASIDLDGRIMIQMELRDVTRERLAMSQVRALNETLEARITERTAELSRSNHDLEVANRDLESFSYSVAHDLRAPLRGMANFAGMLENDLAAGTIDRLPHHVARILRNAAHMNELIEGLLVVSRVTHGDLKSEAVDFNVLVAEVINECAPAAQVKFTVAPLPVVPGDISALRQVWANLISNALKYSAKRPAPQVTIGAEMRESGYVFHVRDNGAGFDPAQSQRLFGVFSRLHSASEFEGTGVGLAVVRRVVERHGGQVWAEGRPNQGATFHFSLPVGHAEPKQG